MTTDLKPGWTWNPAEAHTMCVRAQLEYQDDPTEALYELDPTTQRVRLWRENEVEHSVVTLPDLHVVTYRGTEPAAVADLREDSKIIRVSIRGGEGGIHRGFLRAVESCWDWTREQISDGLPTIVVGHSKGGGNATAAAVLAVARRDPGVNVVGGYTFGSPRVLGGRAAKWFENHFGRQWWRVVNGCDVVTRVPFSNPLRRHGGYCHVGRFVYLDHDGRAVMTPRRWQLFKDRVVGRWEALVGGEPDVYEVPGIPDDVAQRLVDAGVAKLTQVVTANLIDVARVVGPGWAGAIAAWVLERYGSQLNLTGAMFDGLLDHRVDEYSRHLRALAGGVVSPPTI